MVMKIATPDGERIASAEEEAEFLAQCSIDQAEQYSRYALATRKKRDDLLCSCDWTQIILSDYSLTAQEIADWAVYRQALRDLPAHVNFPYMAEEDWPTPP